MRPPLSDSAGDRGRGPLWWFTGALFFPFLLVLVLLWQAANSESGRSAIEDRVLADYGELAAGEVVKRATHALHMEELTRAFLAVGHMDMSATDTVAQRSLHDVARDPGVLLAPRDRGTPAMLRRARTAFRYDVAPANLVVRGAALDPSSRLALERLLQDVATDTIDEPHRLVVNTAGDRLLWLWILREMPANAARRSRFIYGLETGGDALGDVVGRILRERPILPAGLLAPPYEANALSVSIHAPGGRVLWSNTGETPLSAPGIDTLPRYLGSAVLRVHTGPRLASALRIGRPSPLYLPMLAALLALSLGMGAIALTQFKRTREMAQLRERFVANVSHELRTPLTQMRMFAEMLEQSRVRSDEEARRYAAVIRRETERLTTLVDNVLRFSRGRAGGQALTLERRELRAEIADAAAFFAPLAEAANVRVSLLPGAPVFVKADTAALRQILLNLLDNATKYGPRGQTISIAIGTTDSRSARVVIADEGPGIAPADRVRVFDPYVRLEDGSRAAGAGIGLAVVRDLVVAHGGAVWIAESATGTSVAFTLCLATTAATLPAGVAARVEV